MRETSVFENSMMIPQIAWRFDSVRPSAQAVAFDGIKKQTSGRIGMSVAVSRKNPNFQPPCCDPRRSPDLTAFLDSTGPRFPNFRPWPSTQTQSPRVGSCEHAKPSLLTYLLTYFTPPHWKLCRSTAGFRPARSRIICPNSPFTHENLLPVSSSSRLEADHVEGNPRQDGKERKGGKKKHPPRPRIVRLIKRIDALMDQPQPIRRAQNLLQHARDLSLVVAREDPDDGSHGPRVPGPVVRAPDGVDDGALHEVGVRAAQEDLARGLIGGVGAVEVAEQGRGEEGGDVGVVHDVAAAVAVDLVGVEGGGGGVGDDAVGGDGGAQGGGEGGHVVGESRRRCRLARARCRRWS